MKDFGFVYKQSLFCMSARPVPNAKPHPLRVGWIRANKCTKKRVKFIVLQQTIYNEGGSVAKSGVNTKHCTISAEVWHSLVKATGLVAECNKCTFKFNRYGGEKELLK
nr:MAG TPA: hypothetical protein [Bacteriophage sp.]